VERWYLREWEKGVLSTLCNEKEGINKILRREEEILSQRASGSSIPGGQKTEVRLKSPDIVRPPFPFVRRRMKK